MYIGVHGSFWIMFSFRCMSRNRIKGLYDSSIFSFLRSLHIVLHSGTEWIFRNLNYKPSGLTSLGYKCLYSAIVTILNLEGWVGVSSSCRTTQRHHLDYSLSLEEELIVQSLSCVWLFATPWTAACQAFLSFTISLSLLKFTSIKLVMLSDHLILCCPLLLLPSIFPSIRVFSNESALPIKWLKYWSFSFSISHSNEYSGFISFRIDWFDFLSVQEDLKSLL